MIKSLIQFALKPKSGKVHGIGFRQKLVLATLLLFINIVASLILAFPSGYIAELFGISRSGSFQTFRGLPFFYTNLGLFLFSVLFAPFYEEFTSRLFLVFSKKNLQISLVCLLSIFYLVFLEDVITALISFFVTSIAVMLLGFLLEKKTFFFSTLEQFWENNFQYVFYFSVLLFAFLHILDFEINSFSKGLVATLLIMPKMITGVLLGYLRVRLGFNWGLSLHILNNGFFSFYLVLP